MKVALITDQHIGLSADRQEFHDNFRLFYEKIFFPELLKRDIKKVYHLGDVFHQRKKTNTDSIKKSREYFFDPLRDNGIEISILLGNHDTYYKDTNEVNTPSLLLESYDNITVYEGPAREDNVGFVPWINKGNVEESIDFIKNTDCNIILGHFEFKGFKFNKYTIAEHGMGIKMFERFDRVFSGHYHTRSSKDNIEYLGAPTQHTWIDDNDTKGFHIFDTKTLDKEFIKNPHNIYFSFEYENGMNIDKVVAKSNKRFVKVITKNIEDAAHYKEMISRINEVAYDIKNSDLSHMSSVSEVNAEIKIEDTETIMNDYVDSLDIENKDDVKLLMKEFYNEVMTC